jgi:hypothetical protein
VIRLRRALAGALERRWIGPVLLVIVIVLLAFVGLHLVVDHFGEAAAATCGGILIVTVLPLTLPRRQATALPLTLTTSTPAGPAPPLASSVRIARSLAQIPLRR